MSAKGSGYGDGSGEGEVAVRSASSGGDSDSDSGGKASGSATSPANLESRRLPQILNRTCAAAICMCFTTRQRTLQNSDSVGNAKHPSLSDLCPNKAAVSSNRSCILGVIGAFFTVSQRCGRWVVQGKLTSRMTTILLQRFPDLEMWPNRCASHVASLATARRVQDLGREVVPCRRNFQGLPQNAISERKLEGNAVIIGSEILFAMASCKSVIGMCFWKTKSFTLTAVFQVR